MNTPEINPFANCDYRDYMTATLRETKAKLSEMVKRASRGEEVIITVPVGDLFPICGEKRKIDRSRAVTTVTT